LKIEFREARTEITEEDFSLRKELAEKSLEELSESEYNFFVTANKIKDNNDNVQTGTLTGSIQTLREYFNDDYEKN
jgi:hypothetical protein